MIGDTPQYTILDKVTDVPIVLGTSFLVTLQQSVKHSGVEECIYYDCCSSNRTALLNILITETTISCSQNSFFSCRGNKK